MRGKTLGGWGSGKKEGAWVVRKDQGGGIKDEKEKPTHLNVRTKAFALRIIRMFGALPVSRMQKHENSCGEFCCLTHLSAFILHT